MVLLFRIHIKNSLANINKNEHVITLELVSTHAKQNKILLISINLNHVQKSSNFNSINCTL